MCALVVVGSVSVAEAAISALFCCDTSSSRSVVIVLCDCEIRTLGSPML